MHTETKRVRRSMSRLGAQKRLSVSPGLHRCSTPCYMRVLIARENREQRAQAGRQAGAAWILYLRWLGSSECICPRRSVRQVVESSAGWGGGLCDVCGQGFGADGLDGTGLDGTNGRGHRRAIAFSNAALELLAYRKRTCTRVLPSTSPYVWTHGRACTTASLLGPSPAAAVSSFKMPHLVRGDSCRRGSLSGWRMIPTACRYVIAGPSRVRTD